MAVTVTIELPWSAPPISMNDSGISRGAAMARAAKIREIRETMTVLARQANLPRGVAFATITLHYQPRNNAPRDSINLSALVKALVDGLKPPKLVKTKRGHNVHAGYGFVPEDDTRYVSTPESVIHEAVPGVAKGRMWLEITYTLPEEKAA